MKRIFEIYLVFLSFAMNIEYRDSIVRIWGIFRMFIFCKLIQREEIPQRGYRKKLQSNSRTIIILFYRQNKKRRSFRQQLHWLKIKAEYIKSTVSTANKNKIHQIIYTLTVLTRTQSQLIINQFNHLNINQPVQMVAVIMSFFHLKGIYIMYIQQG